MPFPDPCEIAREQGNIIYRSWVNGGAETAKAMLDNVTAKQLPYVIMTMTVLAVHERNQYPFSKFIEEITQ